MCEPEPFGRSSLMSTSSRRGSPSSSQSKAPRSRIVHPHRRVDLLAVYDSVLNSVGDERTGG